MIKKVIILVSVLSFSLSTFLESSQIKIEDSEIVIDVSLQKQTFSVTVDSNLITTIYFIYGDRRVYIDFYNCSRGIVTGSNYVIANPNESKDNFTCNIIVYGYYNGVFTVVFEDK